MQLIKLIKEITAMNGFRHMKTIVLLSISLVFIVILFFLKLPDRSMPDQGTPLIRPPFVDVVKAASNGADPAVANMLDNEAGISAYMKSDFSINLSTVKPVLSTIEIETANYIVGSIDIPDYPGTYDPHIYVHTDGWILAYYLRPDPVSKILDTHAVTISSTLLDEAISIIASNGGVPVANINYYDFRYPNATHMMFVAENYVDGNNFTIEIPLSYGYFERSWASYNPGNAPVLYFDGKDYYNTNSIFQKMHVQPMD